VVLAFHGATMTGPMMAWFTRLNAKSDAAGFLAVYPNGTGDQLSFFWNGGNCCGAAARDEVDDVGFIRALLDDLATAYNVDPRQIFAAGISNGAMMTYRLASELSDRIAAVACVGGTMATDACCPTRPISILHIHGTDDEFVPFAGGVGSKSITGAHYASVERTIGAWVRANGCTEQPNLETLPDRTKGISRVLRQTYGSGRDGAEVVLIVIEGGGHTWPGRGVRSKLLGRTARDTSANDLIWEFFARHPMEIRYLKD
jgi:polyhydroxybutyrate depolymerase